MKNDILYTPTIWRTKKKIMFVPPYAAAGAAATSATGFK